MESEIRMELRVGGLCVLRLIVIEQNEKLILAQMVPAQLLELHPQSPLSHLHLGQWHLHSSLVSLHSIHWEL
jgi:hypothetical protein